MKAKRRARSKPKRLVVISDLHCGHMAGLTPPDWERSGTSTPKKIRRLIWNFYTKIIEELKPIDTLVVNGDGIDGHGKRSGSTELLVVDRHEQLEMALQAIQLAEAKNYRLTFGTAYHTGEEEDFESVLVKPLKAKIEAEIPVDLNGIKFLFRHHMGGGGSDQAATNAPFKWAFDDIQRSHRDGTETPADIYVFSHRHRAYVGWQRSSLVVGTPCLQGESKYGIRKIGNHIDIGLMWFDVFGDSIPWPNPELMSADYAKREYEKL